MSERQIVGQKCDDKVDKFSFGLVSRCPVLVLTGVPRPALHRGVVVLVDAGLGTALICSQGSNLKKWVCLSNYHNEHYFQSKVKQSYLLLVTLGSIFP